MTDAGPEDDEWLYGESAGSLNEDSVGAVTSSDAVIRTGDKKDGDDTTVEPKPNDTPAEAGTENAEPMEEEVQDAAARGRKRSVDNGEGDEVSSDERDAADGEDSEDDDDSDDDGVMVTIGDIKGQGGSPGFGGKRVGAPPPDKKGKFSSEDFDGTGHINGVPAQDFNLDALEDKPWRKPGADITDYFNYGFTEDTWRAYSDRQKRLRYEAGGHHGNQQGDVKYIGGSGQQNIIFPKKFGMQGQQRKDGPMNMMGMGMPMGMGMRRENHSENTIQVMTADRREYSRKQFEMGPMMGPPFDMSIPPPSFPPRGGEFMGPPPEFFNHPPPTDYYDEGPEYEEQQWMDSQWEMEGDGARVGPGPSALVVPLTKVTEVPPPPGEALEDGNSAEVKVESSS